MLFSSSVEIENREACSSALVMGRSVINVVRTCGLTHLSVLFGNKICVN